MRTLTLFKTISASIGKIGYLVIDLKGLWNGHKSTSFVIKKPDFLDYQMHTQKEKLIHVITHLCLPLFISLTISHGTIFIPSIFIADFHVPFLNFLSHASILIQTFSYKSTSNANHFNFYNHFRTFKMTCL